jgi:predicted nuclease of predicted toxin-antitoxin system
VKLLFDENLSPKLEKALSGDFPGSRHVRNVGLTGADDDRIWNFCRDQGYAIASKDTDFRERSFTEGYPPKVIWLDVGNSGTAAIIELLRRNRDRIEAFGRREEESFLILSFELSL